MARSPVKLLACCVAIGLATATSAQSPSVRDLMQQGRWPDALEAADGESDPAARARARVEILFAAGDLAGALNAARAGLRLSPRDPALLWRSSQLALILRMPSSAKEGVAALEAVVASDGLDPANRVWWNAQVGSLREQLVVLLEREAARMRAAARARWTVGVGLALCVAAILWFARGE